MGRLKLLKEVAKIYKEIKHNPELEELLTDWVKRYGKQPNSPKDAQKFVEAYKQAKATLGIK